MSDHILTTGDAAKRLKVSSEFVRRLAVTGVLDCQRTLNGLRLFRADDVERLAAEREQQKREGRGYSVTKS